MSDKTEAVDVDIRGWVESARADPQLYRDRQVTEIVLAAIGLSETLQNGLVLKGGTLMAIAFGSNRVTGDVDFSATVPPDGFDELLVHELNAKMPIAANRLGYLDILCRVQGIRRRPRPELFEGADFPALEVRVGSAERGSSQAQALADGRAARILLVEVSFRDQVYAFQELNLIGGLVALQAFTIEELVAEKLRALLQQPIRNRNRRQDVYDLAYLTENGELSDASLPEILATLKKKCSSRGIEPNSRSLDDPEIARRAEKEWESLRLEVSNLPDFLPQFEIVRDLYRSLPWDSSLP